MQHTNFKQMAAKVFMLTILCSTVFAFAAKAGGDVYEIYLNNKLIQKEALYKPVSLKSLPLSKENYNDQLTIYFFECGKPGKGRSITLKDEKGNILKEWKFADAEGTKAGMTIPVKELLALAKNSNGSISLYYGASGRSQSQILTSLQIDRKSVASLSPKG